MRNRVLCVLAIGLAFSAQAQKKGVGPVGEFQKQISEDQKILQALNRLTFGPRPGDAQAVKELGLKKWIDQQLHPESITENPALLEKLKIMDTLTMSAS